MTTAALIVAAGRGNRLGGETPKQYLPLGGVPMLRHSVETCLRHPSVDSVTVVIHSDDLPAYRSAVAGLALAEPVAGGADRQDSVRRGLERLADGGPARVLIHDAARPFVDAATITRCLDALKLRPGAIAALPVTDSLKRADGDLIQAAVPRDDLWRAQTPQAFHYAGILAAHRRAEGRALTDDAAVAAEAGMAVALVAGSPDNFKVTDAEDLARAERLLAARLADVRVGQGFDVHRFGPGDHVMLCGVPVPHDAALVGHSDADVALHAVTDAILGALGAGDIGQHFPPTDPAWQGAPSALFLRHAAGLVAERGGRVAHVDLTILCERPRIGPHRAAMLAALAALLGLAPDRVSVKATTTERLGFLGRSEGIAAQATVTVRLPV